MSKNRLCSGWARYRSQPFARAGLAWLCIVVLVALLAPFITPYPPASQILTDVNQGPSWAHLLGTDFLGRDILSRLLVATRWSLIDALSSLAIAYAIAIPLGLIAGYSRGIIARFIVKCNDGLQSFPPLLLVIAIVGLGGGDFRLQLGVGIIFVPVLLRLTRASVLATRQREFVEASHTMGSSSWFIFRKRIFHNIVGPLLVQGPLLFGFAIVTQAALGYIGLGSNEITWGKMLSDAQSFIFTNTGALFWPGAIIVLTVISAVNAGRGLSALAATSGGGATGMSDVLETATGAIEIEVPAAGEGSPGVGFE